MKNILLCLLLIVMFSCEKAENNSVSETINNNELKVEDFKIDYDGCEIHAKVQPLDLQNRGYSENVKTYNLILESSYLKKTIITQLVQVIESDGSFILDHFVEGVKIATLYYDKFGNLSNIEVYHNQATRSLSSFTDCVGKKYGELKDSFKGSIWDIVIDCTGPISSVALATTAAADCAGMFDKNIGIK